MVKYSRCQIDRRAQPLHLAKNGAAVVLAPLPHALNKGFAAHLLPGCPFAHHLALDQHLCRDSRMIGSGHPQDAIAAHPVPAREDVAFGVFEHVPHV